MTMRMTVERNQGSTDAYGGVSPDWQIVGLEVPCRVWSSEVQGARLQVEDSQQTFIQRPAGIVPLGADVMEGDRITGVYDRRGAQLFDQMYVDAVLPRADHQALRFRYYE